MPDVVRHGTIIIDLKAGKVELPAPDLAQVLQSKKADADVQARVNEQIAKAKQLQDELTKAQQQAQQQAKRTGETAKEAQFTQVRAYKDIAEGAFRLSRAVVLLGADSDESMQKMIRQLAAVHAGFDLFKGSTAVIKGLAIALGATQAATAALMATLTPYLAVLGAIAGAYALWTHHTKQQTEAENLLRQSQQERIAKQKEALKLAERERDLAREEFADAEFERATDVGKLGLLGRREADLRRQIALNDQARQRPVRTPEDEAELLRIEAAQIDFLRQLKDLQAERFELMKEIISGIKDWVEGFQGIADVVNSVTRRQGTLERIARDAFNR